VPRTEKRLGGLPGHKVSRHTNRRAWLPPERYRRRIGHADHVWRIDDFKSEVPPVWVRAERALEIGRPADQRNRDREVARRSDSAIDHGGRRMVTAHRIDRDFDHKKVKGQRAKGKGTVKGTFALCPLTFDLPKASYSSSTGRTCRCR
jgi:hypothetical protein